MITRNFMIMSELTTRVVNSRSRAPGTLSDHRPNRATAQGTRDRGRLVTPTVTGRPHSSNDRARGGGAPATADDPRRDPLTGGVSMTSEHPPTPPDVHAIMTSGRAGGSLHRPQIT